jgi:23S rRNA (cytidine1920-2'-O)/16S rRNA (cytidine1409-2'-O)-methyltransferase
MTTSRLDAALASRGLARSRSHAARLIADGLVRVDGRVATKPSLAVAETEDVVVEQTDDYVSRAAAKLIHALDAFGVDPRGLRALDVGASTGGFSEVLLRRGARAVIALDVGHGQLVDPVRSDERVAVVEGVNARELTPELLASASGVDWAPELVVGDLSFISLTHVIPPVRSSVSPDADFVLLVKPQFEVGRTLVKQGIVVDPDARVDSIARVLAVAAESGLRTVGVLSSPITGLHGNHEYLVHLSPRTGRDPSEWTDEIRRIAGAGGA